MKPEQVAKLSPEDRPEYEKSLKITKTHRHYALRSRLNFVKHFEDINVFLN
jgi:hypothetical protein